MYSKVQNWGNSLGVRIPKSLAKKLSLYSGSKIELNAKNNHLIIKKSSSELDIVLDNINSSNRHNESFEDDKNIGAESW